MRSRPDSTLSAACALRFTARWERAGRGPRAAVHAEGAVLGLVAESEGTMVASGERDQAEVTPWASPT